MWKPHPLTSLCQRLAGALDEHGGRGGGAVKIWDARDPPKNGVDNCAVICFGLANGTCWRRSLASTWSFDAYTFDHDAICNAAAKNAPTAV